MDSRTDSNSMHSVHAYLFFYVSPSLLFLPYRVVPPARVLLGEKKERKEKKRKEKKERKKEKKESKVARVKYTIVGSGQHVQETIRVNQACFIHLCMLKKDKEGKFKNIWTSKK